MDDPIGRWQVFLDDGVRPAGVIHQDEPLGGADRDAVAAYALKDARIQKAEMTLTPRQSPDFLNFMETKVYISLQMFT